jgi:hypothetical protein
MGKGGMMPPGGENTAIHSDLPMLYATPDKTPFTIKVPPDGPVSLDLKSKP